MSSFKSCPRGWPLLLLHLGLLMIIVVLLAAHPVASSARTYMTAGQRQQVITNQVASKQERHIPLKSYGNFLNYIRRPQVNGKSGRRRGFLSSARAADTPPLALDSRATASANLGHGIANMLHVKQGHYSNIYDLYDSPGRRSTPSPADLVEQSMRDLFVRHNSNSNSNQVHPHYNHQDHSNHQHRNQQHNGHNQRNGQDNRNHEHSYFHIG